MTIGIYYFKLFVLRGGEDLKTLLPHAWAAQWNCHIWHPNYGTLKKHKKIQTIAIFPKFVT